MSVPRAVRLSHQQFEALRQKGLSKGAPKPAKPGVNVVPTVALKPAGPWQSQHKYKAQRTEVHGISFPSKSEAAYYLHLLEEQKAGRLVFFLRQVPIHIPGSLMRLDFQEFWADGRIEWVDVKGMETEGFKIKRRAIEQLYPFKIRTVKQRGRGEARTWMYDAP